MKWKGVLLFVGLFGYVLAFHGYRRADKLELAVTRLLASDSVQQSLWDSERADLVDSLSRLRADSLTLAQRNARLLLSANASRRLADSLLDRMPDSLSTPVRLAFAGADSLVQVCADERANCEARAENAEARLAGDSIRLEQSRTLNDSLQAAWLDAERRAHPNPLKAFWQSRSLTIPFALLTLLLVLRR